MDQSERRFAWSVGRGGAFRIAEFCLSTAFGDVGGQGAGKDAGLYGRFIINSL